MNIETMLVIFGIGVVSALLVRILTGFTFAGCLISYVLACLGGVVGWIVQQQFFGLDRLLRVPLFGTAQTVSIIGPIIGSLVLAYIGGLLGRPQQSLRRPRPRR